MLMKIELSPANEWIDTQMKFIRPQETKPLYMLQQGSPPTSLVKDAICSGHTSYYPVI